MRISHAAQQLERNNYASMRISDVCVRSSQRSFKLLPLAITLQTLLQRINYYIIRALYNTITCAIRVSNLYFLDTQQTPQNKLELCKHRAQFRALRCAYTSTQLPQQYLDILQPAVRRYSGTYAQFTIVQLIVAPELCTSHHTCQVVIEKIILDLGMFIERTLSAAWTECLVVLLLCCLLSAVFRLFLLRHHCTSLLSYVELL